MYNPRSPIQIYVATIVRLGLCVAFIVTSTVFLLTTERSTLGKKNLPQISSLRSFPSNFVVLVHNIPDNFERDIGHKICGNVPPANSAETILQRIESRVECRLSKSSLPQKTSAITSNLKGNFFLVHDLVNANGLGNFLFMVAATLGLSASSGRNG